MASAGQTIDESNPLFNLMNPQAQKVPPQGANKNDLLSQFSHDQILQMYQKLSKGEVPPELASY